MSVRNGFVFFFALSSLSLLVGCGNNNNSAVAVAPPGASFSAGTLNGAYVFSVSGTDFNGDSYATVGTFSANGSGGITGGTIDIVDPGLNTPVFGASIAGNGTYRIGVDGRGQMTINTTSANPFGEPMTFDLVLANNSQGLITEFDGNATGSGTVDAQATGITQSSLTGSYAFSLAGSDESGAFATVGNFAIAAGGGITGLEDFNSDSIPYVGETLTGQVILGPSAAPSTELTTASGLNGGTLTFDVFAIDATHLKFIESDSFGTLSGDAFSQTSATVPTGTLAFTLSGFLPIGNPFAAGGFMVTDGNGNITSSSTEDVNEGGTVISADPVSFSALYNAAGAGRFTLTNFSGFSGGTVYAAYPSSGGLLLMEIDDAGLTVGAAYLQSSTAFGASSQGYGLNLTGINLSGESEGLGAVEVDDIAEFTASANGATCAAGDSICGIIDENFAPNGSPFAGYALSQGNYASVSGGRYLLSAAAGNSNSTTLNGGFNLTFYTVDGTTFPFIEQDPGQISSGVFILQNSSGAAAAAQSHVAAARPLVHPQKAMSRKK